MKFSRPVLFALALPISVFAQQPSGQPPANPLTASFSGRIMGLHRNLAQAFDSIPERLFSYKPTPAQQTIGYIAQHLAADNYFFCESFGDMKATRSSEETSAADTVRAAWPKDKLMASLKESFTFCQNAIGQLNDAKLVETFTVTAGGQTRQVIRGARVLGHAMDLADHYSQLANYMRLNGILPPTALPRPGRGGGDGRD